jgi:hypothetical protein
VSSRGHRLPVGDNINSAVFQPGATTGNVNQRRQLYLQNPLSSDIYKKQGNQWLNPAAFQAPAPGTHGNVPINAFVGPGAFKVDTGITRSFHTGNSREIQFRLELFNVFNTVQKLDPLTPPNAYAVLNSSNFGMITAAADPRIVQLALKYVF